MIKLNLADWYIRNRILRVVLLVFGAVAIFLAVLIPYFNKMSQVSLAVGDVAPQDYLAPYALTFESPVLTESRRQAEIQKVPPVYTNLDTSVARNQLEKLRSALAYITSVRADSYATSEQKLADLDALQDTYLDRAAAEKILALSDIRWMALQQEAIMVLEQVMRSTIRVDHLEDVLRSLPAMVSLSLPEDQAHVVSQLSQSFVAPNSFYNEEQTRASIQAALAGLKPVSVSYAPGQTIVRRGNRIDAEQLEALEQFGLARPQSNWQEPLSAAALTILIVVYFVSYLRHNPRLLKDNRSPLAFTLLFLFFLVSARLVIPGHTVLPYLFPVGAFALTTAVLFGSEIALVAALPLSILVAQGLPKSYELTLYFVLSSYFGILMLQRASRLANFVTAGLALGLLGSVTLFVYRVNDPNTDLLGMATLAGAAMFNGLASAGLTLGLQFFLAQFLGMISPLQLIELTRPDQPLLQHILRSAPGTYQHSLQVANLAEQAAERIGADALLTRVGALYHDAGKAANPYFFIENQPEANLNPHNDLDPITSSATIVRHVPDGVELARKYRLPRRIMDFMTEHHGTLITRYQYIHAVQAAGGDESKVNQDIFRYPGPTPRSRETALLMLADGCEARVRAERPKNEDELRAVIKNVIETRLNGGQLNDTSLTLRQLELIADSFVETMRGIYHPRIEYPKLESATQSKKADTTAVEPEALVTPKENA